MHLIQFIFLNLLATAAFGLPRYIAIPLDDLQKVAVVGEPISEGDSIPIHRQSRELELEAIPYHQTAYLEDHEHAASAPSEAFLEVPREVILDSESRLSKRKSFATSGYGKSGHINKGLAVDYGAYTGKKGAFGWYADFPVISYH